MPRIFYKVLVSFFGIISLCPFGFSQALEWAKSIGGTGVDTGVSIIVDNNRDVFVGGYYANSIEIEPGSEINSTGFIDMFMAKFIQSFNIETLLPRANAVHVSRNDSIKIVFSKNINANTASSNVVKIQGNMTGALPGTFLGANNDTLIFIPDNEFKPGEIISVTVTAGAQSNIGAAIDKPYVYSFTAAAGEGPATFTRLPDFNVSGYPVYAAAADFDNDNDIDMAASKWITHSNITLLFNDGSGGFSNQFDIPSANIINYIITGDFNNDESPDLVLSRTGNFIEILLNDGSGNFSTLGNYVANGNAEATADLNADGYLDIISLSNDNEFHILLNNGDGSFAAASSFSIPGTEIWSVTCADFNQDGALDLATVNHGSNDVTILFNDGTGSFSSSYSFDVYPEPTSISSADFNSDGSIDLVVGFGDNENHFSTYFNDGLGNFSMEKHYLSPFSGHYQSRVSTADMNGDGYMDLYIGEGISGGDSFTVFINDGSGLFELHTTVPVTTSAINAYAFDVDQDDDLDIVTVNWFDGSISVFLNENIPVLINEIPDQSLFENELFDFTFDEGTFNDVEDGTNLTYTATLCEGSPLPVWLTFDGPSRTFSGTPLEADIGTLCIKVTATDTQGGMGNDEFMIEVLDFNEIPVLVDPLPDPSAVEDQEFSFTFSQNTFSDVEDGSDLANDAHLCGGEELPNWLAFDAASRTFTGTPQQQDVGVICIEITASDSGGAEVADDFNLSILEVNDTPALELIISDLEAIEDQPFEFLLDENTFYDEEDGTALSITTFLCDNSDLPEWLNFDAPTLTFSGVPLNNDVGEQCIAVVATDSQGASVADEFLLTIGDYNDPPVVQDTLFFVDENSENGTLVGTVEASDEENHSLAYKIVAGDENETFVIGVLSGEITVNKTELLDYERSQAYDITIEVKDNGTPERGTLSLAKINVIDINEPPFINTTLSDTTAIENIPFSLSFKVDDFEDPEDGYDLTYRAVSCDGGPLPGWISFNPSTRNFSGTPSKTDVENGNVCITVEASDKQGLSISQQFNIILFYNSPPTDISLSNHQILENQPKGTFIGSFSTLDVDGEQYQYLITSRDDNFIITKNSLLSNQIFDFEEKNIYRISIKALNKTQSIERDFEIRVLDEVEELIIPSGFTPNGDGRNDRWEITNINIYPQARIYVFDNSGKIVFSSIGYSKPWDGAYHGKLLPKASYYYIIEPGNGSGQTFKSIVTILR